MKKFRVLIVAAIALFICSQAWSQSNAGASGNSNTRLLADKYGIRISASNADNLQDGKLNFVNSNNKITIIEWNIQDNNGKISYPGYAMTIVPNQTVSIPLTYSLQKALNGKDSNVQFIVKN